MIPAIIIAKLTLSVLAFRRALPVFGLYLMASAARSLVLSQLQNGTNAYGWTWAYTEPVILALWIAVAWEFHRRVCEHYPGIGDWRGRFWWLAAAVAVVVVALSAREEHSGLLRTLFFARRLVASELAVALACLSAIFAWYSTPLPLSLTRHGAILASYLWLQVAGMLAANLAGSWAWASTGLQWAGLACYVTWLVVFSGCSLRVPNAATTR